MVTNQDKLMTKQILEKLLDSKHNCQSLSGSDCNSAGTWIKSWKHWRSVSQSHQDSDERVFLLFQDSMRHMRSQLEEKVVVGEERVTGQKSL